MNQSQFLAITCNSLEAREKSRVHGAIGFDFASHWLKDWRESLKSITKLSNRNHIITFESHLKTALMKVILMESGNELNPTNLSTILLVWINYVFPFSFLLEIYTVEGVLIYTLSLGFD